MLKKGTREFLFEEDRFFNSCHASTLTVLRDKSILCAWFAGTKETALDVCIWVARRENKYWTEPVRVTNEEGVTNWNPVLYTKADGTVLLFYKSGVQISQWKTMLKISRDNGRTWSASSELVPGDVGGRGPVKNKLIVLKNGEWLAPCSVESAKKWKAYADISSDSGKTWVRSNEISIDSIDYDKIDITEPHHKARGVIQPSVWESENGSVHMLLRSSELRVYRSDSADGGHNWCPPYPIDLPNNNSGLDLVKAGTSLYLVCNPVQENWGPRFPLTLFSSADDGGTWREEAVLEPGPGEFSYPAIISDANHLYVTYTWNRKKIAFLSIPLS